jgi:uncharacterized repeat protein (TIGR01451 family)
MRYANTRWSAPRLIGIAGIVLGILVAMLVAFSGGATAAAPADLSITKTDSPDPVVVGNNVTYTIRVTNNGPNDATGVTLTDSLPSTSSTDFVSVSTTAGTCQHTGNTVTCDLGSITNGASQTVTVVMKAKKAGQITDTATVQSADDLNTTNNTATQTTTVVKAAAKGPKKPKGRPSCAAPTIKGTAGDDVITGTSHGDVIATYTGNDLVFAGGGSDLVCTDGGGDTVFAQGGNDTVIGGGGPDRLVGGKGDDLLKGKSGRDRLKGNAGNDVLNGGKNRDRCKGGAGRDVLIRCP